MLDPLLRRNGDRASRAVALGARLELPHLLSNAVSAKPWLVELTQDGIMRNSPPHRYYTVHAPPRASSSMALDSKGFWGIAVPTRQRLLRPGTSLLREACRRRCGEVMTMTKQ